MYVLTFPRRWLCHYVSANIAPTRGLAAVLKLPNTTVIYHAVPDNNGLVPLQASKPATFVFVGRLVSTKGAHVLLQAAHRLRAQGFSFRVKIIGEGPERAGLEGLADALGLRDRVAFKGYVPEALLERDLAGAVAVIIPSLAGEVFGLVAAEQMMRGRVVIAADIGGLGEVVSNAGLRFAPGDVEGLAKRLREVVEAPAVVAELGRKARQRALALFDEERMVADHVAIYSQVLGRNGNDAAGMQSARASDQPG